VLQSQPGRWLTDGKCFMRSVRFLRDLDHLTGNTGSSDEDSLPLFPTEEQLLDHWVRLAKAGKDPTKDPTKEFLSPSEFTSYSGLTESRIRGRVSEGKLPGVARFGRIYIHLPTAIAQEKHRLQKGPATSGDREIVTKSPKTPKPPAAVRRRPPSSAILPRRVGAKSTRDPNLKEATR
jgi:hypothetical protein